MKSINTFSALNNTYYNTSTKPGEIWLYVQLNGGKAKAGKERAPLNISMVMDRSGSMGGEKLEYTKKALEFVINNLNKSDNLSIVQYDNQVEVLSASSPVVHKEILHQKVKNILAGATTNLSGGMLKGYDEVRSTKKDGFVNRALMLSDGLANVGITDPAQLNQMAQKVFREEGIALSTFGVGSDYNEDLMTNLSEHGGGNYYFIDSPDKIPQIFAEEMEGLLAVVAQNASFKVNFNSDCLKLEKAYGGYPYVLGTGEMSIAFNDVFAEEEKAVLLKFVPTKPITEALNFGCNLSYDDVTETMGKVEEKFNHEVKLTNDANLVMKGMNSTVLENITLFVSEDMFEAAVKKVDNGEYTTAGEMLTQVDVYLQAQFKLVTPNDRLNRTLSEANSYKRRLKEMSEMSQSQRSMSQKSAKYDLYQSKKRKR